MGSAKTLILSESPVQDMKAEIPLLLILIFAYPLFSGSSAASSIQQDDLLLDEAGCQIVEFKGCSELMLPQVKKSGGDNLSCLSLLPVFLSNQSINGTARLPANDNGSAYSSLCLSVLRDMAIIPSVPAPVPRLIWQQTTPALRSSAFLLLKAACMLCLSVVPKRAGEGSSASASQQKGDFTSACPTV